MCSPLAAYAPDLQAVQVVNPAEADSTQIKESTEILFTILGDLNQMQFFFFRVTRGLVIYFGELERLRAVPYFDK